MTQKKTGRTLTGLALHKKVVKQWLRVALREIRLEVFGMEKAATTRPHFISISN